MRHWYNHNTIAAITNLGSKPAEALLKLHYDGGKQTFEMQRAIAPGDQMWVNLAQLIRQRIPDRKGSTLPVDVSTVTYDLRDLTQGGHGLIASALAVNSTYGFQASPEAAKCCSSEGPARSPDLFEMLIGVTDPGAIWATDSCNDDPLDISEDFTDWWSGNSAVATVASRQVHAVAAGSTYAYASGYIYVWNGTYCPTVHVQVQAPVTVTCAVPTGYKQTSGTGNNSTGVISFQYNWNSSTGNLADLASCTMKEVVTYPGGNPFTWPSPPFAANQTTPNPTSPTPVPASNGVAYDTHGHPGFQTPYQATSFTATQYYQYVCPCANGGQPVNLMGPLYIFRSVQSSSGTWTYTVTKSGVSATEALP